MILVIGGEGSGKRSFVRSLGFDKMSDTLDGDVVFHAEALVRTQADVLPVLEKLKEKKIVIANEIGCGVVPAVQSMSEAREAGGRLTVLLAKEAGCVVRMVCGIAQIIKGTLEL